ncbi:hypothetical protein [Desulfobacter vibrioformis]|nr:hypothetical protein [Desulfobacter vibrioformis]
MIYFSSLKTLALQGKYEEVNKKDAKERVKLMEVSRRAKDEGLAVDNENP